MLVPIAVILGLAAFLFIFFRVVLWYASAVAKRLVERRHRDAETVMTTYRVPAGWLSARAERAAGEPVSARRTALRRLRSLRRQMERTTLVDSEETRGIVVRKLASVEAHWASAPWPDIKPE